MDYTELLFAAKVYDLANGIRAGSVPAHIEDQAIPQWKSHHPISEFVPEALKRIQATAAQIKSLQAE